jgi:hypothetical protein
VPDSIAVLSGKARQALESGAGERERERWRRAKEAAGDPFLVLQLLEGFESEFPFSPVLGDVFLLRDQADRKAPELSVESDPPGALLRLDGEERGPTPWKGRVLAGARAVSLTLDGCFPFEDQVDHGSPGSSAGAAQFLVRLNPRPGRELQALSDEAPIWMGRLVPDWNSRGEWSALTEDAGLEGTVSEGSSWSSATRDLSKTFGKEPFQSAPGWQILLEMAGRGSRAELWVLHEREDPERGRVVALGIEGLTAYLAIRGPSPDRKFEEELATRRLGRSQDEEWQPVAVEWHGDVLVFRAGLDQDLVGSVRPGWPSGSRILEVAAVGTGTARFRDFRIHPMR